jgi:hypothetical protein
MADIVSQLDIGDTRTSAIASAFVSATAGGAGNNAAVTGNTVDRLDPNTGSLADSAVVTVVWSTVLSATKTLSLNSVALQTSQDEETWVAFTTFSNVIAATATGSGTSDFPVNLVTAERFMRVLYTPDLSNTETDTASVVAVATLGGFDRLAA